MRKTERGITLTILILIIFLLIVIGTIAIVLFFNNDNTEKLKDNTDTTSSIENEKEEINSTSNVEKNSIQLLENLYKENDENLSLIKSIQGKVTYIENGGTFPVLVADNKLYLESYGDIIEKYQFLNQPDEILYFDNIEIGKNIFVMSNGKISAFDIDEGKSIFENIDFNAESDFIPTLGGDSYVFIMSKTANGYNIKYYQKDDESQTFKLYSEENLNKVQTSNSNEINMKELFVLKNNDNGYSLYCLTQNNEVYWVDRVDPNGNMTMRSKTPILTNVDKIIEPASVYSNLTLPIYTKINDNTAVYSGAPGSSIMDTEDNFEISFEMPSGHNPNQIKDIFQVSDFLIFEFDNKDVYYIDEIQRTNKKE